MTNVFPEGGGGDKVNMALASALFTLPCPL